MPAAPVPSAEVLWAVFHPFLCLRGLGWGMGGEHEVAGIPRPNPLKPRPCQQSLKAGKLPFRAVEISVSQREKKISTCNDRSSVLSRRLSAVPAEVRRSRGLRAREPDLFDEEGCSQPEMNVPLSAPWGSHPAGSCPACGHDGVGNVGCCRRLRWRMTCRGTGETLVLG